MSAARPMGDLPVNPAWEVHPAAVQAAMKKGEELLLLDVRQPGEWNAARVEGALLIPLSELAQRTEAELEPWRDRPIAVLCHHGVRSLRAAAFLRGQGFSRVLSVAGGIEAWSVRVDPGIPRY